MPLQPMGSNPNESRIRMCPGHAHTSHVLANLFLDSSCLSANQFRLGVRWQSTTGAVLICQPANCEDTRIGLNADTARLSRLAQKPTILQILICWGKVLRSRPMKSSRCLTMAGKKQASVGWLGQGTSAV